MRFGVVLCAKSQEADSSNVESSIVMDFIAISRLREILFSSSTEDFTVAFEESESGGPPRLGMALPYGEIARDPRKNYPRVDLADVKSTLPSRIMTSSRST